MDMILTERFSRDIAPVIDLWTMPIEQTFAKVLKSLAVREMIVVTRVFA
jgi:hypothetical protein